MHFLILHAIANFRKIKTIQKCIICCHHMTLRCFDEKLSFLPHSTVLLCFDNVLALITLLFYFLRHATFSYTYISLRGFCPYILVVVMMYFAYQVCDYFLSIRNCIKTNGIIKSIKVLNKYSCHQVNQSNGLP